MRQLQLHFIDYDLYVLSMYVCISSLSKRLLVCMRSFGTVPLLLFASVRFGSVWFGLVSRTHTRTTAQTDNSILALSLTLKANP